MDRKTVDRLLGWFVRHGRDLPWRRRHEPYEVLVAEFMLQQTRVETGLRYFDRFLRRFPTLGALAAADSESVLAQWSGLGYYSRARNLHATARRIRDEFGGRIPDDPAVLETLPGIGPYTAGAIASVAYDRPAPSVDGNQARVLGRYLGLVHELKRGERQRVEELARRALELGSPRRINQALMDLGSLVCLSRSPRCGECPLAPGCRGRSRIDARRPPSRRRSRPAIEHWTATLHVRKDRVWLARPRTTKLLQGLWLPPMQRTDRAPAGSSVVHSFSHKRWRVAIRRETGPPRGSGRWVAASDLPRLPHSALTARLMREALRPRAAKGRAPREPAPAPRASRPA